MSERESQILRLLCDGATTAQIAFAFGLAPDTVDKHVLSAREKLRVSNRIELVSYALRHAITVMGESDRPGVIELLRGEGGEIEDLVFRYVSGDAGRELPMSNRQALNSPVSEWVGADWKEALHPLLEALARSGEAGAEVPFRGARCFLVDTGETYVWGGAVSRVNQDRFLLVTTTPLPIPA